MLEDGTYGLDGPTCWPQPYNSLYPHLQAIPLHPTSPQMAYFDDRQMWEPFSPHDIRSAIYGDQTLGTIRPELRYDLHLSIAKAVSRWRDFRSRSSRSILKMYHSSRLEFYTFTLNCPITTPFANCNEGRQSSEGLGCTSSPSLIFVKYMS